MNTKKLEGKIEKRMEEIEEYLKQAKSDSSRQKYLGLWLDLAQELVKIQKSKSKPKKTPRVVYWGNSENELGEVNEK